jgi:hypothetical protein
MEAIYINIKRQYYFPEVTYNFWLDKRTQQSRIVITKKKVKYAYHESPHSENTASPRSEKE